jgi:NitT/TauT family transport system substrate-binding protein
MPSITLLENFRAVFYAPFYATFALGHYQTEGLDVRLRQSPQPAETANVLLSGAGEVAWGGPIRVMMAHDRQPNCGLVLFCEVVGRDPFMLIGRQPRTPFQLTHLLGPKVATVSEVPTPWLCLQHDLRLAGLDPAQVDRVPDRSMAENVAALRAGRVDVIQVFQPFVEQASAGNAGYIWYAAAQRGPTAYTSLYTSQTFMKREPEILLRMTRAMYRTQQWIATHDGVEFAACVASYFPDVPRDILAQALSRYQALALWNETPILRREGFAWLQAACLASGMMQRSVAYEHCVDMRFAEQVLRETPAVDSGLDAKLGQDR